MCLTMAMLVGCGTQRIRAQARLDMNDGRYEQAIGGLEGALPHYPEDTQLRSGLVQARTEALTRLLAQTMALRAAGRFDEAEQALQRAKAFDGSGERVDALLSDLAIE